MEILQLKYFVCAAEHQSFSEAAKRYSVPVSDISQTIKRLEKELDTELFERFANRVSLSSAGKVFLDGAQSALSSLEVSKEKLKEFSYKVTGEIRLLVLCNRRIVTEAIEKFHIMYPDVNFVLSHSTEMQGCDIVVSDTLSFSRSYKKIPLFKEKVLLAVNGESPLCTATKLSEFCDSNFVTMPKNSSQHLITRRLCEKAGFSPHIGIYCDDPFYVRKYVEMGLGVTFVPEHSWKGQFCDTTKLLDICDYERTTYMFLSLASAGRKNVSLFTPVLVECFEKCEKG